MSTRPPSSSSSASETWFTAESAELVDAADVEGAPASAPSSSAATADDALIGATLLGSYEVERVLGEGGMGRIYQARHTRIAEKRFAVKVLRPELVAVGHIRARFEREAQAVARVNHPGVVSIVDVGTTAEGWPYMVCELLNGLDLLAYLRRFGALSTDRVVQMGCRIAEALEAAHARGVIHRDIKPSNIFLLGAFEPLGPEWDRVKLIDFGLSRVSGHDDQLTKTGIVMGTPAYMSPEQAVGERADEAADVYGVGAVLYAAATGVPPFREKTQQETLLAVMSRDPPRPRDMNPAISEELELIIQRAMSKQPEQRYPSMSALLLALSNLEQGAQGAVARPAARAISGVRLRLVVLGACALSLCVAALVSIVSGFAAFSDAPPQLTTMEKILLGIVLSSLALLMSAGLQRLRRGAWNNTARLSEWLPRLSAPLVTALVFHGLVSFVVRFGDQVLPRWGGAAALADAPGVAWAGWSVLLPSASLLAAVMVVIYQSWWRPLRPRRWVWGPVLATAALAAFLAFVRWGLLGPHGGQWAQHEAASASSSANTSARTPLTTAGTAPVAPAPASSTPASSTPMPPIDAGPIDAGAAAREPLDAATLAEPFLPVAQEEPSITAPAAFVAAAPARATTDDPGVLKTRALSQARSSRLADAVATVERLLGVSPESANDPEIHRILRLAAATEGEASRAAFAVMGRSMGSRGPDLLYDLMVQRPALAERAKYQLSRYRVRKLFSPELAIAYDLRFSPSCAARLGLLERAQQVGDQRSVNALSELAGKHQRCGRRGAVCLGPCQREAVQFSRSIDAIVRRLRATESAALAR